LEKRFVRLRVAGLEERVQFVLLRVGDTGVVQKGDELVLGDFIHDDFLDCGYAPGGFAGRDFGTVRCEPMVGSREFFGRNRPCASAYFWAKSTKALLVPPAVW
jgi:hypothetical protein